MIPSAFCTLGFLTSYVGRNEQELYNDESNSIYLSIMFSGTIFGILMVLFFMGGFIGGSLFPDLSNQTSSFKSLIGSLGSGAIKGIPMFAAI